MAGGLAALLDDVAMIAKLASSASTKAVGVIVDDTAVTPQYVRGFSPARELPIIAKIARGSIINKLVIILPAIMLMSQLAPWMLAPLLMLGGTYLCYEGAEKLYELVTGHREDPGEDPVDGAPAVALDDPVVEKKMVSGAIRTDLILSAEIMVLSLSNVSHYGFWTRLVVLIMVGIFLTVLVYGVVALIVKMDDVGLHMSRRQHKGSRRLGRGLVKAMPVVMSVLSTVGIVAMLWVGGHIVVSSLATLGCHAPADLIHHLAEPAHHVAYLGGMLAWLVDTLCSLVVGILIGTLVMLALRPFHQKRHGRGATDEAAATH